MRRLLASFMLTVLCAACTPGAGESGLPTVAAAFYPLAFAAAEVGGDDVQVLNLTSAGAEPHELELTPQQARRVTEAALVVLVGGGFQPAVEKAAGSTRGAVLDVLKIHAVEPELLRAASSEAVDPHAEGEGAPAEGEEPHEEGEEAHEAGGGIDPHVWLDPRLMAKIARSLGERLADADQAHAADHRERAEKLAARLDELDGAFAAGLAECARREVVTSHAAFGYVARRYNLTEVGITGLSPEAEPSPQRLASVASFVRERGVTTIFFETLVSPKVAEALARETGVETEVLDPIEGQPDGGDYFVGMERNLAALRKALGCR